MQKARFLVIAGATFLYVKVVSLQLVRLSTQTAPQTRPQTRQRGAPKPAATQATTDPKPTIPKNFTPIFNGKNLTDWHVSKTNHHDTTPKYQMLHGLIVDTQNPKGQDKILLTNKKYKNFEVYIEIKPD